MVRAWRGVRVKDDWPETRGPVHIRTPHYVRGMQGTVVRQLGAFPNPEDLAFARPAAKRAAVSRARSISRRSGRKGGRRRTAGRNLRALAGAAA